MDRLMGCMDSFDCQVQCEEVNYGFWDGLMDIVDNLGSEDIMDRCEVESLDALKTSGPCYRMEDDILETAEFCELWDDDTEHKKMLNRFELRRVYA